MEMITTHLAGVQTYFRCVSFPSIDQIKYENTLMGTATSETEMRHDVSSSFLIFYSCPLLYGKNLLLHDVILFQHCICLPALLTKVKHDLFLPLLVIFDQPTISK